MVYQCTTCLLVKSQWIKLSHIWPCFLGGVGVFPVYLRSVSVCWTVIWKQASLLSHAMIIFIELISGIIFLFGQKRVWLQVSVIFSCWVLWLWHVIISQMRCSHLVKNNWSTSHLRLYDFLVLNQGIKPYNTYIYLRG